MISDEELDYFGGMFIELDIQSTFDINFEQFLMRPFNLTEEYSHDKIEILKQLKITGHEDLGLFGKFYHDVVDVGPFRKIIETRGNIAERFSDLEEGVKVFRTQLKNNDFSDIKKLT